VINRNGPIVYSTPTDEQVQLTKILADKNLLEEEHIQQLLSVRLPAGEK